MKRKRAVVLLFILALFVGVLVLLAALGARRSRIAASVEKPGREQQLWCLAACAVLTQRNGNRHDILAGMERSDANINSWMKNLSEDWGIDDRGTLFESLRWIEQDGHRRRFGEMATFLESASARDLKQLEVAAARDPELENKIEIVREQYARLRAKSLFGWDYSRYLSLCRWGYLVGYLPEDEAWDLMLPAAKMLQDTFDSWEDLGENYLIGRRFWSLAATQTNGALYVQAYEWLRSDPESPWLNIPWDLDLSAPKREESTSASHAP